MSFKVFLVEEAERDIEDIYIYIADNDSIENADRLVAALEELCSSLAEMAHRGNVPKELNAVGIKDYREVHYKPYRIIYRIFDRRAVIYCVLDGRRDMQSLLQRRLLR